MKVKSLGSGMDVDKRPSTIELVDRGDSKGSHEEQNVVARCMTGCLEKVEDFFGWYARVVVKAPFLVILMSLVVCALCGIGFLEFETESRPENLWVPQNTEAVRDFDYTNSVWGNQIRFSTWYSTASSGSILRADIIQKTYELHQELLAVNVSAESDQDQFPGLWDYDRLCFRTGDFCGTASILDLFDYDEALINSLTDEEVARRVNNASFYFTESGRRINMDDIVGYDNGVPVSFRNTYTLQSNSVEKDGERYDPVAEPWEEQGTNIFRRGNSPLNTFPIFQSAWSDEFGRAIEADAFNLTIAFIIIIAYLFLTLGRRDPVDCMLGLSLCAILSVGLAIAASYGLSAGVGEKYNPLHGVIPFLLIGLGVDDAFILVTNFQRATKEGAKNIEEAMVLTLRRGGMSILITSLTDFLAFVIGSTTNLPALSSFCVYAGIGVLFDFFFQITFFAACMVIDARRATANRRDVAVCLKDGDPSHVSNVSPARGFLCFSCKFFKQDVMEPAFAKFAKFLLFWPVRIIVLVMFLAFIGISSYGINEIETNFRADWFLPSDSYLLDTIDIENNFYPAITPVFVYVRDVDYFERQPQLSAIGTFFNTSSQIIQGSQDYWFEAFLAWAAVTSPWANYYDLATNRMTNSTAFYNGLYQFLKSDDGERFDSDVKFFDESNPSQGITASRSGAQMPVTEYKDNGKTKFNAMTDIRNDLEQAMGYDDARVFAQSFIFWERFGFIREELVKNLLIALAVMSSIVFFLVFEYRIVGAVIIAIGANVLNVFGMAYYWGVDVNFVFTIFLLIAIGLSVDYNAHIGHAFKEASGTAEERVVAAMRFTGPPVFNAIFSTFLSILILITSQTYIFQVFFQLFALTTIFGFFNGLVFLPVLLSLIGGDKADEKIQLHTFESKMDRKESA